MEGLEEKLGAVLNNPQLMQQIMSLAASMDDNSQTPPPQPTSAPGFDPGLISKLTMLAGQAGIDSDQKTLLHALSPYLCTDRIRRLERAMQAAKTARLASDLIGSGALSNLIGR